jgi:hypothetical protein
MRFSSYVTPQANAEGAYKSTNLTLPAHLHPPYTKKHKIETYLTRA